MRVDDTGEAGRTVTTSGLGSAGQESLGVESDEVRRLLHRLLSACSTPDAADTAGPYAALRVALDTRIGNWPEAVRRLLGRVATGVVHDVAVSALRRLAEEGGRHTDSGTAVLAIVLWAHPLDDEDPGDFRTLLTEQRDTSVPDELWEDTRCHLLYRVSDLLRALDARGWAGCAGYLGDGLECRA